MRLASWIFGGLVLLAGGARAEDSAVQVTLHDVAVSVRASSVLKDTKNPNRYSPAHLLDDNPETVWSEGSKGNGAGEWVELSFPPGTAVDAFLVTPGNTKSAPLYRANARPRRARLDFTFAEGKQQSHTLEFSRTAPMGSALYIIHRTPWTLQSARLTVLSVWPGSKYRDLCLGTFIPVFNGPDKSFRGEGKEMAPTFSHFMHRAMFIYELLPTNPIDEPVWLRFYDKVPHDGPLPTPVLDANLHETPRSAWSSEAFRLEQDKDAAILESHLFRVSPAPRGKGYVLDPSISPKPDDDNSGNFRLRWRFIEEKWKVVEINMKYREPVP